MFLIDTRTQIRLVVVDDNVTVVYALITVIQQIIFGRQDRPGHHGAAFLRMIRILTGALRITSVTRA